MSMFISLCVLHTRVIQARAYLMVQGLRICLQGAHIHPWSELDPHAPQQLSHASRARAPQQESHCNEAPHHSEESGPRSSQLESGPCSPQLERLPSSRDPALPEITLKKKVIPAKFQNLQCLMNSILFVILSHFFLTAVILHFSPWKHLGCKVFQSKSRFERLVYVCLVLIHLV